MFCNNYTLEYTMANMECYPLLVLSVALNGEDVLDRVSIQ